MVELLASNYLVMSPGSMRNRLGIDLDRQREWLNEPHHRSSFINLQSYESYISYNFTIDQWHWSTTKISILCDQTISVSNVGYKHTLTRHSHNQLAAGKRPLRLFSDMYIKTQDREYPPFRSAIRSDTHVRPSTRTATANSCAPCLSDKVGTWLTQQIRFSLIYSPP